MKRLFFTILALMATSSYAFADAYYDYTAAVYRAKTTTTGDVVLTRAITGITYRVLTAGADTDDTLYAFGDDTYTSKTNPVTTTVFATDDAVKFRSTASSVDLLVVDTVGGYKAVINGFTPQDHKVVIDETDGVVHTGMIWYDCETDTSDRDTGVDFNYDTAITGFTVEAVNGLGGGYLDVGLLSTETSGDANGFIVQQAVSSAGYVTTSLVSTGTLLDDGTNFRHFGHIVTGSNAKSLTYSCSSTDTSADGYLYWNMTDLR